MELLGYSLYKGADSLTPLPPKQFNGMNVKLENGAFDELAFSTNIVRFGQPIVNTWESDTILHAKFDNNLRGGNLAYRADTVSMVRVKRREQGESMEWITIKEVPVTKIEDFTFTYIDMPAPERTMNMQLYLSSTISKWSIPSAQFTVFLMELSSVTKKTLSRLLRTKASLLLRSGTLLLLRRHLMVSTPMYSLTVIRIMRQALCRACLWKSTGIERCLKLRQASNTVIG